MKVAVVAGESSGDLLGAGFIRAFREREPNAIFEGVAGPEMQAAGCEVLEDAEALAVMGLIEPLTEIPRLLRLRRRLVRRWLNDPPTVFIGIDAPDFNLGIEKRLRTKCIKTVHYVSPSVWAWRQGRIRKIADAADKVLCLFPFEKFFYDERGVSAEFVGHPMADCTPATFDIARIRSHLGIQRKKVVAVLPGSRMSEVTRLGPVFAATAKLMEKDPDIDFVAPMASSRIKACFRSQLEDAGANQFILTDGDAESVLASADVVLLASGTAALQAALVGKPMVAAYKLSPLTYAIVKAFNLVQVPYFTLPNLLTDDPLVLEFLQGEATPTALSTALSGLLSSPERCLEIASVFKKLRADLARGADQRAANAVFSLLTQ